MSPSSNQNLQWTHERNGFNGYPANPFANTMESVVFCYTYTTICRVACRWEEIAPQKVWIGVIDENPVLTTAPGPWLQHHHKDYLICKLVKQKLALFTKIYCKVSTYIATNRENSRKISTSEGHQLYWPCPQKYRQRVKRAGGMEGIPGMDEM